MKRLISLLIFSCTAFFASPQEKIVFDSIPKAGINRAELSLEKPLLLENSFSAEKFSLFDESPFYQPLLPDFTKKLNLKKAIISLQISTGTYSPFRFGYSPFFTNGIVFNQATYNVNNRFSFGGNSFGAQSVFDRPGLNQSVQNMSTKGATMFMQYKVSKNFKIETRVSVSNHQSLWGP